jgi:hypothetical protein
MSGAATEIAGTFAMTERLIELARKIESQPCNRPGTDKTWVLEAIWQRQRFEREIRATPPIQHVLGR